MAAVVLDYGRSSLDCGRSSLNCGLGDFLEKKGGKIRVKCGIYQKMVEILRDRVRSRGKTDQKNEGRLRDF